jgi:pimeloyl-ACP methyl ester carboxylesterase
VNAFVSLPSDIAECRRIATPAGRSLTLYRLHGARKGPTLLFGHANGFAAGSYATILKGLAQSCDVFAFDAAGHGGSDSTIENVEKFCAVDAIMDDVEAIVRAAQSWSGTQRLLYAAHSLCGAAMLALALFRPARFAVLDLAGLMLFEPPLYPLDGHPLRPFADDHQQRRVARTLARRSEFKGGPAELTDYLAAREMFADFPRDAIAEHARATLRPENNTWRLACAPQIEAGYFLSLGRPLLSPALPGYRGPKIHFVAGDIDAAKAKGDWVTGMMEYAHATVAGSALTVLPGRSHMMIFEDRARCLALLQNFANNSGS